MKPRYVCLTGGGTGGHIMPHLALIPYLQERGTSLFYIGSSGMEKTLIEGIGVEFYQIPTGKLRRYFSTENFKDFFRFLAGIVAAFFILRRKKPDIVFSKGGYVSVPVALAAWMLRIPVLTHESDLSPGMANRIIAKVAQCVVIAFSETVHLLKAKRIVCAGIPVRDFLLEGDKNQGLKICGFSELDPRPICLVMGGSLGAEQINNSIVADHKRILEDFKIIHLTGKGKQTGLSIDGYVEFSFVTDELKHLYACSDLCISRAGANSIFELLVLKIPMLLIPLEAGSRGDQIHNALFFQDKNWARVIREKILKTGVLYQYLKDLWQERNVILEGQKKYENKDSVKLILDLILGGKEKDN